MAAKYKRPQIPNTASADVQMFARDVIYLLDDMHNPPGSLPYVTKKDVTAAITAAIAAARLLENPVGKIIMSTVNTNPGTYIGGTWVAWGSGRVPVGVDAAQTEFDTVEETGGAKTHTLTVAEIPSHTHSMNSASNSGLYLLGGATSRTSKGTGTDYVTELTTRTTSLNGSDAAHNNLQPYITCYMFKRVS